MRVSIYTSKIIIFTIINDYSYFNISQYYFHSNDLSTTFKLINFEYFMTYY